MFEEKIEEAQEQARDVQELVDAWVRVVTYNLDISISQMAAELGVSQSTLSNWRHGRSEPAVEHLLRIFCHSTVAWKRGFSFVMLEALMPDVFMDAKFFGNELARFERNPDPEGQMKEWTHVLPGVPWYVGSEFESAQSVA